MIARDLKHAVQALRREPAFAAVVALTLGLGLGVNGAVLGLVDALLLRPYQFANHERLLVIREQTRGRSEQQPVAAATFLDWRSTARTIDELSAWEGWSATLIDRGEPERLQAYRVSPGFFELLGITPASGRSFARQEDQPGRHRVVVISDGLWKRRFGGRPVVGQPLVLDDASHVIVGVAPPEFEFPTGAEVWVPLAFTPETAANRTDRTLVVMGRLARGRSLAEAQAEMDALGRRLERQFPDASRDRVPSVLTLNTAFQEGAMGGFVGTLQAAAALVLFIACANLAGLLFARANDRRRELALRAALGASRAQIVRQLVIETVVLGLVASTLAILLARVGLDVLRSSISPDIAQHIEGWNNVRFDRRLLVAIPALAIAVGLLVGLIPALAATRGSAAALISTAGRGAVSGGGRQRSRQALVVAEIAFALALLIASASVFGAAMRMVSRPGGFDGGRMLTFEIPLPSDRYASDDARREFGTALVAAIERQPGVEGVVATNVLPAAGWSPATALIPEGLPPAPAAQWPQSGFRSVSPGFFEIMGIPIVSGRPFSAADRETGAGVAVVSASLAERLWRGAPAAGKRVRLEHAPDQWVTVVGVAGDVSMYNWWDGVDHQAVYVPLRQHPPRGGLQVGVRTRGEPTGATSAVRHALGTIDPRLPLSGVKSMQRAIADMTFGLQYLAWLMAVCGGIALALAVVGIYSMMAYAVSQRTHEFGVRMALGATAGDVLRLSVRRAAALTAGGVAIGLVLAFVFGRLMSASLFDLVALDPLVMTGIAAGLAAVALGAAYVPARRSLRVDPAAILRAG